MIKFVNVHSDRNVDVSTFPLAASLCIKWQRWKREVSLLSKTLELFCLHLLYVPVTLLVKVKTCLNTEIRTGEFKFSVLVQYPFIVHTKLIKVWPKTGGFSVNHNSSVKSHTEEFTCLR